MRHVRHYEYGGPEVLRVEDADVPEPGPGELLIRTEAIGVSLPSVRKVREGGLPLPGVFGGDVAGGGGTAPAWELLAGARTITGMSMARFSAAFPESYERHRQELWDLAPSGRLRVAVHETFALADPAKAHAVIEARANLGNVVLRP